MIRRTKTTTCPQDSPSARPSACRARRLRIATHADLPQIVEFERELLGLERAKDHEFLFRTAQTLVAEGGGLQGSLTRMVRGNVAVMGPALARDAETLLGLLAVATEDLPKRSDTRLLLPTSRQDLLAAAYRAGFEVHSLCTYMVRGDFSPFGGYYIPTLFPESG